MVAVNGPIHLTNWDSNWRQKRESNALTNVTVICNRKPKHCLLLLPFANREKMKLNQMLSLMTMKMVALWFLMDTCQRGKDVRMRMMLG